MPKLVGIDWPSVWFGECIRLTFDLLLTSSAVGGAAAGNLTPVPGYFLAVRQVCDKYGVLLILDEIMCGMGRTGKMHAWEWEGMSAKVIPSPRSPSSDSLTILEQELFPTSRPSARDSTADTCLFPLF
jgi:hypothetical protein